ncbi:MAG: type I-E CRISPR-associated protein Cse2/CasB [Thermodesulfobacteriota bacterium]
MAEQSIGRIFTQGDESSGLLVAWWEALEGSRGERASLRRAAGPAEVAYCAPFHSLLAKLRQAGYPVAARDADRLAAVAGLAAHVRAHAAGAAVARQMAAAKTPGAGARVSGLRFRRLMAVADRDELYPLLLRVVRLLDGTVNLVDLARAVYWWNERTKKEWAYEYYAAAPSEL